MQGRLGQVKGDTAGGPGVVGAEVQVRRQASTDTKEGLPCEPDLGERLASGLTKRVACSNGHGWRIGSGRAGDSVASSARAPGTSSNRCPGCVDEAVELGSRKAHE